MNKKGPIIVIEDDRDDQEILGEVFQQLSYANEVRFFDNGYTALEYLNTTTELPFLILSDVNMPKLDGFELREKIITNASLSLKCIPYLYFTTAVSHTAVINAYSKSAQGFFMKPASFTELENIIKKIVEYWLVCYAPNNFPGD